MLAEESMIQADTENFMETDDATSGQSVCMVAHWRQKTTLLIMSTLLQL